MVGNEYKIDYKLYGVNSYQLNPHTSGKSNAVDGLSGGTPFPGALNFTSVIDYQFGPQLGQGNYAQVKQATHRETGMLLAIKVYDKFKLSENIQVKKSVCREIKLLSQLSNTERKLNDVEKNLNFATGHPNIMKLYDAIDTSK